MLYTVVNIRDSVFYWDCVKVLCNYVAMEPLFSKITGPYVGTYILFIPAHDSGELLPTALLHPFHISSSRAPINRVLVSCKYDQAHCNNARQLVLQHRRILLHQVQGYNGLLHMIQYLAHSRQDRRLLAQSTMILMILKSRKRRKLQLWNGKARLFMLQVRKVHLLHYVIHSLCELLWRMANSNC